MKYQVTVLDARDYILEYKDFGVNEVGPMLKYINKQVTRDPVRIVKIQRWND